MNSQYINLFPPNYKILLFRQIISQKTMEFPTSLTFFYNPFHINYEELNIAAHEPTPTPAETHLVFFTN